MTMTELHGHWDERERRYARRRHSLTDDERVIISAYRRGEVVRLVAATPTIASLAQRAAEDEADATALAAYVTQWSTS